MRFSKQIITKIIKAGLIAGTLDVTVAFIDAWLTFNVTPREVLNGIAAGAIGKNHSINTFFMPVFGLLIHFFIVYSYTFFFYLIYPFLKSIFSQNIIVGVLYGLFIWVTMRFIVLPVLSQVEFAPFWIVKAFKPMLILIGAIGIPLSLMIDRIIKLPAADRNHFIEIENPMK